MTHRRTFLKTLAAAGVGGLAGVADSTRTVEQALARVSNAPRAGSLEDEYMLAPGVTYFNHASIGTIPRVVHEAQTAYLRLCETNPWLYMWGGEWEAPRENVRALAAAFGGATPAQTVITHNTTEGFNMLAQGLPIGMGDEVVFSSLNHPGASVCFQREAMVRRYEVHSFEFPIDRIPDMSADDVLNVYDEHITPRTTVLVFPHIDNIVGLKYPVNRLAQLAHDRGVDFVAVDGAQSLGMVPLSFADSPVDFYSASPHKWIQAPKGLGLLYMKEAAQTVVRPMRSTWGQKRWEGTSRVFEDYGTRNMPELLALGDAIDFQTAIGADTRATRYAEMRQTLMDLVSASDGLSWRSPRDSDLASSIHAIGLSERRADTVAQSMYRDHGYVFRPFASESLNHVRVSLNMANSDEQIQRFVDLATRG